MSSIDTIGPNSAESEEKDSAMVANEGQEGKLLTQEMTRCILCAKYSQKCARCHCLGHLLHYQFNSITFSLLRRSILKRALPSTLATSSKANNSVFNFNSFRIAKFKVVATKATLQEFGAFLYGSL